MLVLIAIDESRRGTTTTHRGHAVDGELVAPVVLDCADPACDTCNRSWIGLASDAPTTIAMVVERPGVDDAALRERVHDWLDRQGTIDLIVQAAEADDPLDAGGDDHAGDDPVAVVADLVDAHVAEITSICAAFPVGTIVSRLGQLVAPRPADLVA